VTRRKGMTLLRSGAVILGALCAALIVLFPVYWIAVSSVKPTRELISPTPTFWPRQFTGRHFATLFQASDFTAYLVNSTVVSLCTVGVVLVLSVLGAYSLSRFRYPGREWFGRLILFTYIFPGMLSLPFGVWVLKAFMDGIPLELEEVSMVDGASRMQALGHVLLPLVLPGLGTVAIYTFITSWAEYMFPLILIVDDSKKTVPLGLAQWMSMYSVEWGAITAGVTVSVLPTLVLFALVGKSFIRGLTQGAVKG